MIARFIIARPGARGDPRRVHAKFRGRLLECDGARSQWHGKNRRRSGDPSVIVHRPAGAGAAVPEAGTLDGAPVLSDYSVRVRDLFT